MDIMRNLTNHMSIVAHARVGELAEVVLSAHLNGVGGGGGLVVVVYDHHRRTPEIVLCSRDENRRNVLWVLREAISMVAI